MSKTELKNKISKSLEQMDVDQLKSMYSIIKELIAQQQYPVPQLHKKNINSKISIGIKQLNNGEGKDFGIFLNALQEEYGRKK